ncbi:MAG TPA: M57 family metalloprotease [Chitinophagaceae bacterium]|jgi:hypothetical protein|nr:M57 family metalloprotease [Chitinophagaceae bacterium]
MKKLSILALLFLAACSKKIDQQISNQQVKQVGEKQSCDFGMTSFNLAKRAPVSIEGNEAARKKRPRSNDGGGTTGGGTTDGGGTTTPPPSPGTGVILLDFDGDLVSGTLWNSSGDFYCSPANLTDNEISLVVQRVINDYSPFNIIVTTDEAIYNAANIYSRVRVVVTESWEWYGKQVGGVSYLGTFTSGGNTPSFVFSSLLSYNSKFVAEAISHEAGHSFGLRHQALYDGNCVKISDYNYGQGSGEIGWAPIMGSAYSQNMSLWHNGPNSIGCTSYQDDAATIAGIVGYRTDDYSNSFSGSTTLTGSLDGTVSNSNDVDFFSLSTSTTRTVSVTPFNVGLNNSGANTDLVLRVYNSIGMLLSTVEDPSVLSASVTLDPGDYFISVGTTANLYAPTYGMLGRYNINLY